MLRRMLAVLSFVIALGATNALAQTQYPAQGLEAFLHLDLKEYSDTTLFNRISHVCGLEWEGRRFAIVGTNTGTAFVEYGLPGYGLPGSGLPGSLGYQVTFFSGAPSLWRECRTYKNYAYVVTEGIEISDDTTVQARLSLNGQFPGGMQIFRIDRVQPRNGSQAYRVKLVNTYVGNFNTAHTVTIDTLAGRAYVNGSDWRGTPPPHPDVGGLRILDIGTDPEHPRDLGSFKEVANTSHNHGAPSRYAHDSYALGEVELDVKYPCPTANPCPTVMVKRKYHILYTADIYNGYIYTLDASDPKNIAVLDSTPTPLAHKGISVHNAWTSQDRKWLFATEETNGSSVSVFDISDPRHPQYVTAYRSPLVADSSIAHNVVVRGDTAYVAWYTEGVRLIDVTDPRNPKEVGFFDSSSEPSFPDAMKGNWSVWPDSQRFVLISDMQSGLFILKPAP